MITRHPPVPALKLELAGAQVWLFESSHSQSAGCLRSALNEVCSPDVEAIRGPTGRLWLLNSPGDISLSHTAGVVAVAWVPHGRVGIDLEHLRDLPDLQSLAAEFLTDQERQSLPPGDPHAFLRLWTAKEAAAKAFDLPLDALPPSLPPPSASRTLILHSTPFLLTLLHIP